MSRDVQQRTQDELKTVGDMNFLSEMSGQGNFIAGEWTPALSGRTADIVNPSTGEVIGQAADGDGRDARMAIEAAGAAFKSWRRIPAGKRAAMMNVLAGLIRERRDELAEILTLEQGKPLAEARGELDLGAAYIQWFAEEARRIYGDTIPSPWPDRRILVQKEAVGVVAAITPWNFPSSMLSRKLGAALAAGCTVVAKPAPQTPFSALAWAVLAKEAGIPDGVINIVTGQAEPIGAEMIDNPIVRKITFTGSTAVGLRLASAAAAKAKRVSMELGGNAPYLVFADADIDAAVRAAMPSKFRNAGQTCVCANRFLVQDIVFDEFSEKFLAMAGKMKIGDGREEGVEIGPLIDSAAYRKVISLIEDARSKGARISIAGDGVPEGNFIAPALVTGVTDDMRIAREEIFGPVAPVFSFSDEEEAIRLANDTEYGLACYFWTRDLNRSIRVSEALRYGQVEVNAGFITTEVAPFGGVKSSGFGREGSKYGCEDYLDIKYVCIGEVR